MTGVLRISFRLAATTTIAVVVAACGETAPQIEPPVIAAPPRPPAAVVVAAGSDLQRQVDDAEPGSWLALEGGNHAGPVRIDKPLGIWGPGAAVIRSGGVGSTVDVAADGVTLLGFTVNGSGARFDLTDAAVRVRADDVRIEGVTVIDALFGILVEQSDRVIVRGNVVRGKASASLGLRGDGIRLWEVRDSVVAGNHVVDSRDVVVWYSSGNRIANNLVERSRYGTHFMYSHENVVADNDYVSNVVGVFVMYSRGVSLTGNLIALSSGAAGLGLGLKESGQIDVTGNRFVRNGTAVHSDNSPLNEGDHNTFRDNLLMACDTGVAFNGIAARTSFLGNVFRTNGIQVRVDGGDDAQDVEWLGNDFDDYRGYDLDGDGVGDVPYELRRLSTDLTDRSPQIAFLRGTPAMTMIDVSSRVLPLLRPRTILVDPAPSLRGLEELNDER